MFCSIKQLVKTGIRLKNGSIALLSWNNFTGQKWKEILDCSPEEISKIISDLENSKARDIPIRILYTGDIGLFEKCSKGLYWLYINNV